MNTSDAQGRSKATNQNMLSGIPAAIMFIIPIILVSAAFYAYEASQVRENVFSAAQIQGEFHFSTISYQVSDSLYMNNIEQIRKDSEFLIAQPGVRRLAVFTEDGRYLFDSAQQKVPSGNIDSKLLQLSSRTLGSLNRWGERHIEIVGAIRFDGDMMGGLYLETDVGEELDAAIRSIRETTLVVGLLVAMFLAFSIAIFRFLSARRSLEIAESNYRMLIEQSPLPHATYKTTGEITYFNPALRQLMQSQAATRHITDPAYNILEDPVLVANGVAELLRPGFTGGTAEVPTFAYSSEQLESYKPGTIWLRALVSPLRNDADGLNEVVVIYEDKTAEKKTEAERAELSAQILQSQKLEGLGVMARGIAHDFNNLLTPVMGNADLLAHMLKDDPRYVRLADKIITGARRASDLCGQLLAYGGRGTRARSLIDVSAEVREMNELLRSSVSKKTSFEQDLAESLPPVLVDESQLRQVILNLLINASEALEDGQGVVTLATGATTLENPGQLKLLPDPDLPPGHYIYLRVMDTGCGMDAETLNSLFDPFFTTKFTGRGLGMSTVLGIVGDHAGGIAVESEPGKGSVFTVYLPVSSEKPDTGSHHESDAAEGSGGTILLIDDEPEVLEIGRQALESLSYEVVTASNGADALRRFEENQGSIRCVVMDLLMPVMDGEETLARLRRIEPDIPVVMVTGLGVGLERLTRQPNLRLLNKPYEIQELEEAIASVVIPG